MNINKNMFKCLEHNINQSYKDNGIKIPHSKTLELAATSLGFKDYNALNAELNKKVKKERILYLFNGTNKDFINKICTFINKGKNILWQDRDKYYECVNGEIRLLFDTNNEHFPNMFSSRNIEKVKYDAILIYSDFWIPMHLYQDNIIQYFFSYNCDFYLFNIYNKNYINIENYLKKASFEILKYKKTFDNYVGFIEGKEEFFCKQNVLLAKSIENRLLSFDDYVFVK